MLRKFLPVFIAMMMLAGIVQMNHSVEANNSSQSQLIANAKKHLGTPYRYGGTTPSGFDCSGYINYVMKQSGVSLPRTVAQMHKQGTAVAKSDLQVGDIVFFTTVSSGPSHAGIYIGNSQFIHSATSKGVSIASINDPYYWGKRYIGAKRYKSFDTVESAQNTTPKRELGQGEYHDIPTNHWAYTEIKNLSNMNVVTGTGNDNFGPNDKITRAQLAVFITRATNLPTSTGSNGFNDVADSHWAAKAISAADAAGYFDYIDGSSFKPEEAVTRDEIAVLLTRAFNLDGGASPNPFADVSASNWAYEEIHALQLNGIIKGFTDGTYRPNDNITRAEFAKAIHTAIN